jgi:hypothetical protein
MGQAARVPTLEASDPHVIKCDVRQLRKLEEHLVTFKKKALPFAVSAGLNSTAFTARKEWVGQMERTFTLRNKYTTRSLRVVKSPARRTIESMSSRVGSPLAYLGERERGSTKSKRGKHGVAIPTAAASAQGKGSKRTRSIRRTNYLSALNVGKGASTRKGARGRGQRNAASIAIASRKGGGVVYLDLGRRKGLFRVEGRKKGIRIRMLYDLTRSTVTTRAMPTLGRTLAAIEPRLPRIQRDALLSELRRHRILWYGM